MSSTVVMLDLPSTTTSREESMLGEVIAVAKVTFTRCLSAAGRLFKRLLRPAPAPVVAGVVQDAVRSKCELVAENAMLRQQLIVAGRAVERPSLRNGDRLFMVLLARLNRAWRGALHLIQPDTLLRWHRDLFKVDIKVSKRTVQRHMRGVRDPKKPPQDWNTFLANHAKDVWACEFVQVFDVFFRPIFAFFIIEHESRRVIHFNVTRSPSDDWVGQALREATAYCQGPRCLIRDNDDKFGAKFDAVARACETKVIRTAVTAPLMNSVCERFLGSVRRECLDHILILGEGHLRRLLAEYADYFVESRPHQGLGQRTPAQVTKGEALSNGLLGAPADVESIPVLGGLHHEYRRAA